MKSTIKVLWISRFAPMHNVRHAGGKTLDFYISKLIEDTRFDVRFIACGFYKDKETVEADYSGIRHKIVYWNNPKESKINKVLNIESKYNVFNRYAQLVSNTDVIEIKQVISEYKEEGYVPDIIILEWTNMVMLVDLIKQYFHEAKYIASEVDVAFVGYKRKSDYYTGIKGQIWKMRHQWEKMKELASLKVCDLIMVQNPDNKALLVDEGVPPEKIDWLTPYYFNMSNNERAETNKDILFFGSIRRPENYLSCIWFIENVMPSLKKYNVRFIVLGDNPPEEIKKYESEEVVITGYVDSISPYFEKSMCFVAPLVLGAGIKVKVIEAMSSGIPVITNNIGIEGISAVNGKEYFHCEQPEEYIALIERLIAEPDIGMRIGEAGRQFIQNNFLLDKAYDRYSEWLLKLGSNK